MSQDHHLYPQEWLDPELAKKNNVEIEDHDDAHSQAEHLITLPSFQAMCAKEEEVGA